MKCRELKKLIMEVVKEEISALPVVVRERKAEYHECPHCKKEIYEKHTYHENGVDHHSDCGGAIKWPEPDWSQVVDWLKPKHIKEAEADNHWKNWVASMVSTVEEEPDFVMGDGGRAYDLIKTNFRADAPSREMFNKACAEALRILKTKGTIH